METDVGEFVCSKCSFTECEHATCHLRLSAYTCISFCIDMINSVYIYCIVMFLTAWVKIGGGEEGIGFFKVDISVSELLGIHNIIMNDLE